ncbi:sarcosine oxidase subunit gamma [Hellea balneolensis]|uniref:sarcosine oxidase subunit gamma n=1 Tax=Hellea balneolensis TaxID=287478 RepID=UPI00041B14A8|nr:sarcosine oxidase subunit gamma family protein [Hellea balneolensis]
MSFDQAIDIPEIFDADDLRVTLLKEKARYSLRLKSQDVTAIKKASGLKLPAKIMGSTRTKDIICAKLGPDEWIVIADPTQKVKLDKTLAKVSKEFTCSITEISHRNVGFEISGSEAAQLINVGCPMDLSLDKFPVGKAVRTLFESASILLIRTDEHSFHLECWRSFGPYLRDFFARVISTR